MAEARTYHLLGNLLTFLARSSETDGAYCLVEAVTAPGAGAPPNRHPQDDEAFYVVEGRFAFSVDGVRAEHGPGAFVRIPRGAVHAFENVGHAPGRLLILNCPGHVHEAFFSQAGEAMPEGTRDLPAAGRAPDIPAILAIGARSGLEFVQ